MDDTRLLSVIRKPVFVDSNGSRRRLVTFSGVAIAVVLLGWLAFLAVSFAAAVTG